LFEREVDLKRKTAAEVVSAAVLFYGVVWFICSNRISRIWFFGMITPNVLRGIQLHQGF
jgi:hypothetical protein